MATFDRSGLPTDADPSEPITRFAYEKRHWRPKDGLTEECFALRDIEVGMSFFRTIRLTDDKTWDLFERHIKPYTTGSLRGRADLIVSHTLVNGHVFIPDDDPERHGQVMNWPPPGAERQARLVQLQQHLFELAVPVPIPKP